MTLARFAATGTLPFFFLECLMAGLLVTGITAPATRGTLTAPGETPTPGEPKSGCSPRYSTSLPVQPMCHRFRRCPEPPPASHQPSSPRTAPWPDRRRSRRPSPAGRPWSRLRARALFDRLYRDALHADGGWRRGRRRRFRRATPSMPAGDQRDRGDGRGGDYDPPRTCQMRTHVPLRLALGRGASVSARARPSTASIIGSVSLPVNVFCWLGW